MAKFSAIFLEIKERIEQGNYAPGTLLPSEHQLAEDFKASRETIRKALRRLQEAGYIHKQQGRGSVVLDVHRFQFPVSGLTSFKELKDSQNMPFKTVICHNEIVPAPDFLVQAGLVEEGERMHLLIRQRIMEDKIEILDKDYIRCRIVPELPSAIVAQSLYHYLEDQLKLKIAYAKKEFTADNLSTRDAALMQSPIASTVIAVRSEVFLEDTQFLQYTESLHKLDKFRFIEFARRSSEK